MSLIHKEFTGMAVFVTESERVQVSSFHRIMKSFTGPKDYKVTFAHVQ